MTEWKSSPWLREEIRKLWPLRRDRRTRHAIRRFAQVLRWRRSHPNK